MIIRRRLFSSYDEEDYKESKRSKKRKIATGMIGGGLTAVGASHVIGFNEGKKLYKDLTGNDISVKELKNLSPQKNMELSAKILNKSIEPDKNISITTTTKKTPNGSVVIKRVEHGVKLSPYGKKMLKKGAVIGGLNVAGKIAVPLGAAGLIINRKQKRKD